MKILNKIIWALAGVIFLVMVFFSAFGVFYFMEISKAKKDSASAPMAQNQNQQTSGPAFSATESYQPKLDLTAEQIKALNAIGIDSQKLNDKQTQECIIKSIGSERIQLLMNGAENPSLSDVIKFKACF